MITRRRITAATSIIGPEYDAAVERAREELSAMIADVLTNELNLEHFHHKEEMPIPAPIEYDMFICRVASDDVAPIAAGEARDRWNAKMKTARNSIIEGMATPRHGCIHTTVEVAPRANDMGDIIEYEFNLMFASVVPWDCALARARRAISTEFVHAVAEAGPNFTLYQGTHPSPSHRLRFMVNVALTRDVGSLLKSMVEDVTNNLKKDLSEMDDTEHEVHVEIRRSPGGAMNAVALTAILTF